MPKVRLLLLLFTSVLASPAAAQYTGISAFAALHPQYPCDALLAATDFSARPAIAVLPGTFGDDWSCVARFIQRNSGKPHAVEVHLSNETCRRNHNCADGELYPQFDRRVWSKILEERNPYAFQAIADRISNLNAIRDHLSNPNTTWILSTGLEDNYTNQAFSNLYPFVAAHWGGITVRSGHSTKGVLRESHGANARCSGNTTVVNEDGAVQTNRKSDKFLARNSSCFLRLLWRPWHQGRSITKNRVNPEPIPPKLRTFSFPATDVTALGGLLFKHTH